MSELDTVANPEPRVIYGRRVLIVLWAVASGSLFRSDSPYRYAQAGEAYPWFGVGGVLALISVEAILLFLLLKLAPRRSPATNVWRAAAGFLVLIFINNLGTGFHSPAWRQLPGQFAFIGTGIFATYALLLTVRHWRTKR